jgi:hypothetical protein
MATRVKTTCRSRNRRTLALAAAVLVAAGAGGSVAAESDVSRELPVVQYPVAVGSQRQLLFDDAMVESMRDLRRTYHQVTKHAQNPILVPEKPWETQARSILPLTVLRDSQSGTLRVWYSAWGKQVDKPTFMCVADSRDGLHWQRPSLGIFEFDGSKDNNILREGRMFRVLFDPRDPDPARRYKAIIRDAGFLAGFSSDGLRWKTTVPILQKAYDASSVHWDPVGEKWIASCKIWRDEKRMRGYAESKDFLHWTDIAFMLIADEKDKPGDQLYSMSITPYEGIYLGLLKVYDTAADRCDVQLAFSRNAKHWQRPARTPFLPNSPQKGQWDYGNLDPSGDPIRMGDELWFFYSGRSTLHNEKPNDGAMGVAMLRLDGFASVGGPGQAGVLTTKPLVLRGRSLWVNADAKGGTLRVEVLGAEPDSETPAVASLGHEQCQPITADGVRQEVRWNDRSALGTLGQRPVRLRFQLQNARLYSFWSE